MVLPLKQGHMGAGGPSMADVVTAGITSGISLVNFIYSLVRARLLQECHQAQDDIILLLLQVRN